MAVLAWLWPHDAKERKVGRKLLRCVLCVGVGDGGCTSDNRVPTWLVHMTKVHACIITLLGGVFMVALAHLSPTRLLDLSDESSSFRFPLGQATLVSSTLPP